MRSYRILLIVILALVVGFILGLLAKGCNEKVVMIPQTIKAGDILKWKGVDPTIGTLALTIPDGLCEESTSTGKSDPEYHVYVIKADRDGECTVKTQSDSSTAIPWYYKYDFEPAQGAGSKASAAHPPIEMLDIVGSCDGCNGSGRPGVRGPTGSPTVYEQVELLEKPSGVFTPHVVDGTSDDVPIITVPSTKSYVHWQLQGAGVLSFTFAPTTTPPCNEIVNSVLKGSTCTVLNTARVSPGTYPYFVSVGNYSSGSSSTYNYTLTLQPRSQPTPK